MRLADVVSADRLTELLAPFAETGLRVRVETPAGELVAEAGETMAALSPRFSVDIRAGRGAIVGRLTITGGGGHIDATGRAAGAVAASAIGMLVDAATRTAKRAIDRAEHEAERRREHDRVEAELALSRRVQRSFVPLVAPEVDGWDLASAFEPAREIGGDFFDVFRIRDRRRSLGLVIADVTGKGIAAALLMAFSRPLLRAAVDRLYAPAAALERTNAILVDERRSALFITAIVAVLDARRGNLRVAAAGHEPPLVWRASSGALEWFPVGGPMLGAFSRLGVRERKLTLYHGDMLLCYTDGVTDARSPTGERFGERRLRAAVRTAGGGPARDVVAAIVGSMQTFQAGTPAADDVTILALRRLPAKRRARGAARAAGAMTSRTA